MNLGKALRSLFKAGAKQDEAAGWAFTIQSNLDLKRQTVYVYVADETKAEAVASEAVVGLIVAREPVTEQVLADLGVQRGQHKFQAGTGWSFSIQGPPGTDKALVVVYLSDASEAEAVALKIKPGTILNRSEVPPVVLIQDLGLQPGGTRVV
jgi:hypothetical protein